MKNEERLKIFVDFSEYTRSGGDMAVSQKSAYKTCKAFLTNSMDFESMRRRGVRRLARDIRSAARGAIKSTRKSIKSFFKGS